MATMLKIVLSLVVCLTYLCLEIDTAAYGRYEEDGYDVNGVEGTVQCPELQYKCTRSDCRERCAILNYRKGRCISRFIKCNNLEVLYKKCTCFRQGSSEIAGAGEGSLPTVSNSDVDNSNYGTSVAKTSASKPDAASKATYLDKPTAAPGSAGATAATAATAAPAATAATAATVAGLANPTYN